MYQLVVRTARKRGRGSVLRQTALAIATMPTRHEPQFAPPRDPVRMSLNGFKRQVLAPLLESVTDLLAAAELHRRSVLELAIGELEQVAVFDDAGEIKRVSAVPLSAVIDLPLEPDRASLQALQAVGATT